MNTASLELCRELYELSGWTTDEEHPDENMVKEGHFSYDLGYLLRKLPVTISRTGTLGSRYEDVTLRRIKKDVWIAYYNGNRDGYGQADTPENALCQLAIQLFKQGILKK